MANRIITYRQALNEAIAEEMRRDPTVFIMGENIAERGGSFKVTKGLLEEFGAKRVIDTPLAEATFTGAGLGAAITGMRPIVELTFVDFCGLVMDQLVNQAAKYSFLKGCKGSVPLVIRTQGGSGNSLAAQHSQSLEAWFYHIPGLQVVMPAMPADAKGLLKTAIRGSKPVIFIEHKQIYDVTGPVEENSDPTPFGQAVNHRTGTDITIIAWSKMVHVACQAADLLSTEGISCTVLDPRTLHPLDRTGILESVKKTHRCIIVQEAVRRGGVASDISSILHEELFTELKSPVIICAGKNTPIPFPQTLEPSVVPQIGDVVALVKKVLHG